MADERDETNALSAAAELMISIRTGEGISVEDAAEEAQIEPERLALAEAGEIALTEAELERLADSYGVAVTAFFGGRTTPISYLFGV